jgi:hypothetical protein
MPEGKKRRACMQDLSLFGRMSHRLNYNDIIKNTYIES